MIVAILGAMREEIEPILERFQYTSVEYANNTFYLIDYAQGKMVVAYSKIGKVNSAITASVMIEHFKADYLIFTGVAGSLNADLKIGDLLLATSLVQHDVDICAFGHKAGFIPETSHYIKTNEDLNKIALKSAKDLKLSVKEGIIATSDQFICSSDKKEWIKNTFNADACEMEGASVALVCEAFKIPCVILRAISDEAGKEAEISFDTFLKIAATNSANLALKICENLKKKL